jgi:tRNA threonylcarbamoyladenosine biosynthesis protein TsaB
LETLVLLAIQRIEKDRLSVPYTDQPFYCPMLDARRMEVYMALFDFSGHRIQNDTAVVVSPDTFSSIPASRSMVFFGSGASKCRDLINKENAYWIDGLYPSAGAMAMASYRLFQENRFEDIAYFEPFYLKDFITTVSRKNILSRSAR